MKSSGAFSGNRCASTAAITAYFSSHCEMSVMGILGGVGRVVLPGGGSSADTSTISTNLRDMILFRAVVDRLAPGLYGPGWWS